VIEPPCPHSIAPVLALHGITKAFPGCLANESVDLLLHAGEIHALLGENGAGKSTLVKILTGVLRPDSGRILWDGTPVRLRRPADAQRLGIGAVYQQFTLFETLTVAENVALGLGANWTLSALRRTIPEVAHAYGMYLDPDQPVYTLSVGEQQRLELVRCLLAKPRLLILDEPTAVLTPQEAEALFITLRKIAGEGHALLYISHKLGEIRALCHRATILRAGRVVAEVDPRQETSASLATAMLGDAPPTLSHRREATASNRPPLLTVHALSTDSDDPFDVNLQSLGFEVRAGEIFGIIGVAGNGQRELLAALSGEWRSADPGTIRIGGIPAGGFGPHHRRSLGLSVVPDDRLGQGTVPDMDLTGNSLLTSFRRQSFVKTWIVRFTALKSFARSILIRFNVVAKGPQTRAAALSGGNLQKFIVGREILQQPKILIAAAPTWGLDAGATGVIQQGLIDLARSGAAVVLITPDMDEVFTLSDRIAVLAKGRLSTALPSAQWTIEDVGLLMLGDDSAKPDDGRRWTFAPEIDRPVTGPEKPPHAAT